MQEEQKEPRMPLDGKESGMLPEIEESETSFMHEESIVLERFNKDIEKDSLLGDISTYCTICNKQIEKYGRRKEDLKKPGWVFCPKHGWIQEGFYNREKGSENPIRLSIEEVQEDYDVHEKPIVQEECKILPEIETSKELPMQEDGQQETEFYDKRARRIADSSTKVAKNKLTFLGIIVSLIFFIIAVSFLLGYFFWKGSSKRMLEIKSLQALAHNEKLAITQVQSKVSDPSQESVSPEKSTDEFTDRTSLHYRGDLSADGQPEEFIKKTPQTQKPQIELYTVQVGAFTNIAYAQSLRNRLDKKGYNSCISTQNSNKEGRLHKVWIGKFSSRKKAGSLSVKITQAEDIQAFVTLWENNI
jgi:cell division septation protein DedD